VAGGVDEVEDVSFPSSARWCIRTVWALIVIPRSRSRSILSRNWSTFSRSERVPVSSRSRSARVDFPWSMWAMMEKLRMFSIRMSTAFRKISPCLGSTPA